MRRIKTNIHKLPQNIVMTFITTVWNAFVFVVMLGFAILISPILIIIFLPVIIIGLLIVGLMFGIVIAIIIASAKLLVIIGLIVAFAYFVEKIWRVKQ